MANINQIKLFETRQIRSKWEEKDKEWYFSIIDVVGILAESKNPRKYWSVLKTRLKKEGSEVATNCSQLKLKSSDGKFYKTDVANTKQLLRIIQTIRSPKAEPFKLWLAKIGQERLDEIVDPQIAIERAIETYRRKGYGEEWITQRMWSIESRKELTGEWDRAGVNKGVEYAILTDEISKAWSEMTTREYKNLKNLKKENLRDNMSNIELVLNMLAETATTELSKENNPKGFSESKKIAKEGGGVAGNARKDLEGRLGRKVISEKNSKVNPKTLDE